MGVFMILLVRIAIINGLWVFCNVGKYGSASTKYKSSKSIYVLFHNLVLDFFDHLLKLCDS